MNKNEKEKKIENILFSLCFYLFKQLGQIHWWAACIPIIRYEIECNKEENNNISFKPHIPASNLQKKSRSSDWFRIVLIESVQNLDI